MICGLENMPCGQGLKELHLFSLSKRWKRADSITTYRGVKFLVGGGSLALQSEVPGDPRYGIWSVEFELDM